MPKRRHPGLPIPEDWDGQSWVRFAVCWPDSVQWRAILAGFITTPMQGRAWDGDTGSIIDTQVIGREIFERNLDWRYALVASCDDGAELSLAIRYLADRLFDKQCCGSSGSVGGPGTGGSDSTGEEPGPDVDPEGDPPDGYETWDAYYADVCKKAWWLVNTVYDDITRMGTIQLVGATLLGLLPILAGMLLDPIPGDELVLLAGVLIAIARYGSTTLQTVKGSFGDARGDMVCSLYSAAGPDAGKVAAIDVFRTQIENDTNDPVIVEYGVQLVSLMLSYDGLNKVYSLQTDVVYPDGDDDCSSCVSNIVVALTSGTTLASGNLEGANEISFVATGFDIGGFGYVELRNDSGFPIVVEITDLDGWTNRSGVQPVNWRDSSGVDAYSTMGVAPDYRTYDVGVGYGWQLRSGTTPLSCGITVTPLSD